MLSDSAKKLYLFHILDGLREGLSRFSGPSRVALIYAERPEDSIRVYDPQNLLQGHEPKLKELYLDSDNWRVNSPDTRAIKFSGQIYPEKNLELAGLISYGGRTRSVFYQMWFTEHHPDMCSIGPTERWLEHAVTLLSHDFTVEDAFFSGTSGFAIRQYATHAVRDFLLDELTFIFGWDSKVLVFPVLDVTLGISKTPEEGIWPRGEIVFIPASALSEIEFLVRFPVHEQPSMEDFKHVRKLLQTVEFSDRKLISHGRSIVGIATGKIPKRKATADFRGDHGFLTLNGDPICSFSDGSFHSSTRRPKLVHLEEALLESPVDPSLRHVLFNIVSRIVHEAGKQKHGCTLVIDLSDHPHKISGQQLEHPIDLREADLLDLAKSMAKVDGALHIGADCLLYSFACLLDGRAVQGESRARGARFNSALRFTSHHKNIIVVVVSADKPVSVIRGGVDLTNHCDWEPFIKLADSPPTMTEWLDLKEE